MKVGRQRGFDEDTALEAATEVFWANGYSGTSLSDLTSAMGINKPSLYSAFGNKEQLFRAAIEKYAQKQGAIHLQELYATKKNLKSRIRCYLESIAKMATDPSLPGGCFLAVGTCEAGGDCLPAEALSTINKLNEFTKQTLIDFFSSEKSKSVLNVGASPEVMAGYIMTIQFGLAVMARNGATLKELEAVIKHVVSAVNA